MTCDCSRDWRLEILDLGSGRRLGWLPFLSFEMEDTRNAPGTATITCSPFNVTPLQVWPHLRAIAFTRTAGPGASPSAPYCEAIGMIERMEPDSDGNLQIGLRGIEAWLDSALIEDDVSYLLDQNNICSELVDLAVSQAGSSAIPLTSSWDDGSQDVDIDYLASDDKVISTAISELIDAESGPSYRKSFTLFSGAWTTNLHFADSIGEDRGTLEARRGLVAYSMAVDATSHLNWLRGRSESDVWTDDTLSSSPYPKFAKAKQWSDLTSQPTLVRYVNGELANNYDPAVLPDVTIARLDIAAPYQVGDTIALKMASGALQYSGSARILSKSWSVSDASPTLCTLTLEPPVGETAADLVLNAAPRLGAECC